eukprot:Amastigsp_a511372_33.p4 type:complete len:110 gc:universal Amastigsp_a511372_33:240-569(+)
MPALAREEPQHKDFRERKLWRNNGVAAEGVGLEDLAERVRQRRPVDRRFGEVRDRNVDPIDERPTAGVKAEQKTRRLGNQQHAGIRRVEPCHVKRVDEARARRAEQPAA